MSQGQISRNALILFMGERIEHALTSIQKYVPEVVYIVTSDTYCAKHKRRLKEWSKQYGFRDGGVKCVDNLFHQSAVTSILNEVLSIEREEIELHEDDMDIGWYSDGKLSLEDVLCEIITLIMFKATLNEE